MSCMFCGNGCEDHPACKSEYYRRRRMGRCTGCGKNEPSEDLALCVPCIERGYWTDYPGG